MKRYLIASSILLSLLAAGCGESTKSDTKKAKPAPQKAAKETTRVQLSSESKTPAASFDAPTGQSYIKATCTGPKDARLDVELSAKPTESKAIDIIATSFECSPSGGSQTLDLPPFPPFKSKPLLTAAAKNSSKWNVELIEKG